MISRTSPPILHRHHDAPQDLSIKQTGFDTLCRFQRCCGLTLASLALGLLSPVALGVNVSAQGLGQVLLYPYYTVRSANAGGAYDTLFSVTNTTPDTKIVRVRFREGRNGREVASMNVFLTAHDSWAAAVTAGTQGPTLASNDGSCVDPPMSGSPASITFSNAQYSGPYADGEDTSLSRAAEGYFEVIELGVVKDPTLLTILNLNQGFRSNCAAALAVPLDNSVTMGAPTGGLMGSANIINVAGGTLYAYDATALENFSVIPMWALPTAGTPTLENVNPKLSRVLDNTGYREANWDVAKGASAADPVSAVLMVDQVLNGYVLDVATNSKTDWIVSMPTKPFYVNEAGGGPARPPFESNFGAGGAPDYFGAYPLSDCSSGSGFNRTIMFNREGANDANGCLSPSPPPVKAILPWTTNVVRFAFNFNTSAGLLGSAMKVRYPIFYRNGWAKLAPFQYPSGPVHKLVSTDSPSVTYYGLPMIGFMANDFVNNTLSVGGQNVLSNYSATSPHKGIVRVQ